MRDALSITHQLLVTALHIHTNRIVHRDLKSGNVVITHDDKGVRAWTIDFGMSKRIIGTEDNTDVSNYEIVTATCRAPELWRPDFPPESSDDSVLDDSETCIDDTMPRMYNQKVDIWSIGCILFEIITGSGPFSAVDEIGVRKRLAGHILHITGKHDTFINPSKPSAVNIEKELDDAVR